MEKWNGTNSLQGIPVTEVFPKSHSPYKGSKWGGMNKMWAQQVVHHPARLNRLTSFCFLLAGVMNALGIDQAPREQVSVYTDLDLLQILPHKETDVWNLSTSG